MAVVRNVACHVIFEDLIIRGIRINPDAVGCVANGCSVALDLIRLEQVRVRAQQQDPAAAIVLDVVLPHNNLRGRAAPLRYVTAQRDRISDVVEHAVVRDFEPHLSVRLDAEVIVEDLILLGGGAERSSSAQSSGPAPTYDGQGISDDDVPF